MKKVLTVVGARPQFIKAAVLSRIISNKAEIKECIVHTGQHFDSNMSDVFFEEMQIPKPHYFLDIHGLSHGAMTGRMMEGIEQVILKEKPHMVLVYGDTNSTLAGALAAKKLEIPVAHVEAGLRSFNMQMPEEINRILTDRISDILYVPTQTGLNNLKKEGFDQFEIQQVWTGDIMLDAALYYGSFSANQAKTYANLGLVKDNYVLATIHRQENTDDVDKLLNIISALNEIHAIMPVCVPIHPRTRKIMENHQMDIRFKMIDPVGYFDMLELLKHCALVITDSGGLQKEAYYFLKNSIILREQTEWLELTQHGFSQLAGANTQKITTAFHEMFKKANPVQIKELFGEGHAGEIIYQSVVNFLR